MAEAPRSDDIGISNASEDDIEQLIALYKTCRAHSDMQLVPEYFQSFPDSLFRDIWTKHFAAPTDYRAKVLWQGRRPAGFYRVGPLDKDDYKSLLQDCRLSPSCGELHQIYLLPEFQHRGLGKLLYQNAVEDLIGLGYRQFVICTYTENETAKDFYKRVGAKLLKEDILEISFSGRQWRRPVSFFIHDLEMV